MRACRTFSRACVVPVVLVLGLLAACSRSAEGPAAPDGAIPGVDVSGDLGAEPIVRIAAPLAPRSTRSEYAIVGTGPQIQVDQVHVLQLTLYNARSGAQVASTLSPGQVPLVTKSSDDTLFPALVDALAGKPQGSRVVVALTAEDAFGSGGTPPPGLAATDPVVVVADVLAVPPETVLKTAEGRAEQPPAGSPEVETLAGDPSGVRVPAGAVEPDEVTVVPLVTGSGPVVRDHSLVAVDYLGQGWGSRFPFVSTYFKEPSVRPVGAAGSMAAWDRALVGLPTGSRVLVIDPDPPARMPDGSSRQGRGTICWVIDVLGAS